VGRELEFAVLVVLLVASVFDLRTRRIPNALSLGGSLSCLAIHGLAEGPFGLTAALGWAVVTAFVPAILHLKDPNGMGGGDVKLALLCGASFGWLGPLVLAFSASSALIGSGLIALIHGPERLRAGVPFAPYLAAGAIAAMLAS